uniref:Uncharacterized protein n=1 Tax=Strongyloides venezuelensis TaxID=75913 RepID=A0A0K0F9D9_STRVS
MQSQRKAYLDMGGSIKSSTRGGRFRSRPGSIPMSRKEKDVHSVGKRGISSIKNDNVCSKENRVENINVELQAVTNLTVINDRGSNFSLRVSRFNSSNLNFLWF